MLARGRVDEVVAELGADDIGAAFAKLTGAGRRAAASGVAA